MKVNKETSPALHDALLKWVHKRGNTDAVEVTSINDDTGTSYSGCDTCGYGNSAAIEVWVYYTDAKGNSRATYTSDTSFSEMLNEMLTD